MTDRQQQTIDGLAAVGESHAVRMLMKERIVGFLMEPTNQLQLRWGDPDAEVGPYAVDTYARELITAVFDSHWDV